jgi:hypothetical protein
MKQRSHLHNLISPVAQTYLVIIYNNNLLLNDVNIVSFLATKKMLLQDTNENFIVSVYVMVGLLLL